MSTKTKKPRKKKEIVKEVIQAPYHFSESETAEIATNLSRALREIDELDEQKKAAMADFKSRVEQKVALTRQLRNKLDTHFEMRPFEAVVEFDTKAGRKKFVHPKTREVIREDEMTAADWQLPMFKPDEKGKEAVAPRGSSDVPSKAEAKKDARRPKQPKKPATNGAAGQTNVGNALDQAAALSDQPKMALNLDEKQWEHHGLMKTFRKSAKAAGWPEAAVSALRDRLRECDTVEKMIDTLRPHCEAPATES